LTTRATPGNHHNLSVKPPHRRYRAGVAGTEVELTIVTLVFDAADGESVSAVLAKYVVLSRQQPGCRNIDLCASVTIPGRMVVIQKWESPQAQQAHFNSAEMVEMARSCQGLLTRPPDVDLLQGLSAHDIC
jgi:quinol monooxygenase YgiN